LATDRRFLRRIHLFAARLAIIAMLIDGLLPAAASAAARSDIRPSVPLCSTTTGAPLPAKEAPALPARHCALCSACAACVASLPPPRRGDGFVGRIPIGAAHPTGVFSARIVIGDIFYRAAQPRAPPIAFS
jgi:hypothetical protein